MRIPQYPHLGMCAQLLENCWRRVLRLAVDEDELSDAVVEFLRKHCVHSVPKMQLLVAHGNENAHEHARIRFAPALRACNNLLVASGLCHGTGGRRSPLAAA